MINYGQTYLEEGMSYEQYRQLVDERLAAGETTSGDASQEMLHYTKMNVQRMNRLDKTVHLHEDLLQVLMNLKQKYHLLVISEGWCGDAAQIVPVFHQLEQAAPSSLDLRLVLRDQHLELIDAHLTNGGRSIPVLLVLNEAFELVVKWGPRPAVLKPMLEEWKKLSDNIMVVSEHLHAWYAKDKTQAIQEELSSLFKSLD